MSRAAGSSVVGRYRLERMVGRGGMGEVWDALDLQTRRNVAIKWLLVGETPSPELVARFQREMRLTAEISSRHIVGVHDGGRDDRGDLFMVMDLLDGEDLATLVARLGPLAVTLAARIAAQTCDGLAIAHAAGVVHRDIKPSNLFLARAGDARVVKILDFGIAKPRKADETELTRTGAIVGSPAYMAPEQLRGARALDHRADVWALGVVLYRMLAGAVPHAAHEDSLPELVFAICGTPAPPLRDRSPWVPTALAEVVHRALKIDVDERIQSVRELADGLAPWLGDGTAIAETLLVPRQTSPLDLSREPDTTLAPAAVPPTLADAPAATPVTAGVSAPLVIKIIAPAPKPPPRPRRIVRPAFVAVLGVAAIGGVVGHRFTPRPLFRDPPEPVVEPPHAVVVKLGTTVATTDGARWFAQAEAHCTHAEVSAYLLEHPPKLTKDGTAFAVACLALAGDAPAARAALESVSLSERWFAAIPAFDVGIAIARFDPADPRVVPTLQLAVDYAPHKPITDYYLGLAGYLARDPAARTHLASFLAEPRKRDGYTQAAEEMVGELDAPSERCALPIVTDPDGHRISATRCSR